VLRALYGLGLTVGVVLTAIGLLAPIIPQCEMPNHFRPFILLGSLCLIALGLASSGDGWPKGAVGLALLNLALMVPVLAGSIRPAHAVASSETIKIASLNLLTTKHFAEIDTFLRSEAVDVVAFQEVQGFHGKLLEQLRPLYPHQLITPWGSYGVALLSKRALVAETATGQPRLRLATGLWTSPGGKTVRIVGLHLDWPFMARQQAEQIDRLIARVGRWPEPLIVMGDFNLTPWSWKMNKLTWRAGLSRHGTFAASWPVLKRLKAFVSFSDWPLPPLALIDNVLTSPGISGESFKVGPDLGSDHLPIVATLRLP
jgi:endonuclease/exonuclease/phosphatase family metal-dependent hydrolase